MSFDRKAKQLLDHLAAQGCIYRRLGIPGYRIFHPNGIAQYTLHLSVSDHRGLKNLRAQMKRDGLTWPEGIL